jgi:hypothetical protein
MTSKPTKHNLPKDVYADNHPDAQHPTSQPDRQHGASSALLTFWLEPDIMPRLLENHTASLRRYRALLLTLTALLVVGSVIAFATVFLWVLGMFLLGVSSIILVLASLLHLRVRQRQGFLTKQARALRVVLTERQLELHNARWSLTLPYDDISSCDWCTHSKLGIPALCLVTPAFTMMLQGFARSRGLHAALQVLISGQKQPAQNRARAILLAGVGLLLALAFWQRHHPWALLLPPLLLFAADLYALKLPQQITGLERFRPQRRWYLRPRIVLTLLTVTWSVWLLL